MGSKASTSKVHNSQSSCSSKLISLSECESSPKRDPGSATPNESHACNPQSISHLLDFLPEEEYGDLPQELSASEL